MSKQHIINWLDEVEEHDYPAAFAYLNIFWNTDHASNVVQNLREADITQFKAKDIFRASTLSLLGVSNSHVEKDLKKIKDGKSLSPLLLVRDEINGKVIIADGYHRMCAIYAIDEDALIHCKIV
jgi:disulfide oxidoreductase YuzD